MSDGKLTEKDLRVARRSACAMADALGPVDHTSVGALSLLVGSVFSECISAEERLAEFDAFVIVTRKNIQRSLT